MSKSRSWEARDAKTLAELVKDFRRRLGPRGPLEHGYLDWIAESGTFEEAAFKACQSKLPNGKRHNHQSRVPMPTLNLFALMLVRKQRAIRNSGSFGEYFEIVESCAVKGIGPVTVYDVAVRLGAYTGHEPTDIHLHAGVKHGAEALGIETRGKAWLTKQDLPHELRRLTADECEDFLCVYRTLFPRLKGGNRK